MSSTTIQDQDQRKQALDISRSCIVQAPAGSGKTELLIQRYLTLLSRARQPEEILAITFTNKAASEMRSRILEALDNAGGTAPKAQHEKLTWELARKVAARDLEQDWMLRQSPGRLKIQTIDSLCRSLTRQLPLLSAFGGQPGISDNPQELYLEAARAAILHLEQDKGWGDAVATLLRHLDNDIPRLEGLLVSMLEKRDQWLRHIVSEGDERLWRKELEHALVDSVGAVLTGLVDSVPPGLVSEILQYSSYAATNIQADGKEHAVLACLDMQAMPTSSCETKVQWQGLADLFLTQRGELRKKVTKNEGFPPDNPDGKQFCKQMKEGFHALLEQLKAHPEFISGLAQVRILPPIEYTEQQWQVLQALFLFLKIAVAELTLVMAERAEIDFIEMALAANKALGSDDNPTDLAMLLDYRIQHILIDEFQDTSYGQYELLRKLTRGWEPQDGRTLFVVGDPMQSIYLFREAEVGLYLRSRQVGIAHIPLTPITLRVNFRSEAGVVEWVNQTFRDVFPSHEDLVNGAVTYAESVASHPATAGQAVQIHPYCQQNDAAEARRVRDLVQAALGQSETDTVAILVRNRNHLVEIIPELKQAGLTFQAVNVESLAKRPVISDLMALTRALLLPADKIAWLAILRAPWCGLTLEDMLALAGTKHNLTLQELLHAPESWAEMSADGQTRLRRVVMVLQQSRKQLRRRPLRDLVEGTWLALGGTASIRQETELEEAGMLFELLEQFDHGADVDDFAALESALDDLYAPADVTADGRLQLMTMHGAKGLEFDHVIIPGLGKGTRPDESRLMYWFERNTLDCGSDLLLAPIKGTAADADPIYSYLRSLATQKEQFEYSRLLYVAATRARKRLHLLGHTGYDQSKQEVKAPGKNSLLASLWHADAVKDRFMQLSPDDLSSGPEDAMGITSRPIRRLPAEWQLPEKDLASPIADIASASTQELIDLDILEFDWASETARHVGTLVHRYLQRIAQEGTELWDLQRIGSLHKAFSIALLHLGVPRSDLDDAASRVSTALSQALTDEKGSWVLSQRHRDARSEYALSSSHNGQLVNIVVDRTFIDKYGVRWIIDYKTGSHEGRDVDAFLDQEMERYRGQMERYAAVLKQLEDRPIKLGLYFPLMTGWRSWEF